jgi:hypothetical protein
MASRAARFHNTQWADKMESIGLMPSSTGRPGGKRTGDCMADYAIQGGRFLQAVQQLIEKHDFAIAWYDRMPPSRPHAMPPPLATVDGVALPARATQVPANNGLVTVERPLQAARNSSNRVKYHCAGCKTNLWGKPGLSINCNACDLKFDADE